MVAQAWHAAVATEVLDLSVAQAQVETQVLIMVQMQGLIQVLAVEAEVSPLIVVAAEAARENTLNL
jgi:hypothetical protein